MVGRFSEGGRANGGRLPSPTSAISLSVHPQSAPRCQTLRGTARHVPAWGGPGVRWRWEPGCVCVEKGAGGREAEAVRTLQRSLCGPPRAGGWGNGLRGFVSFGRWRGWVGAGDAIAGPRGGWGRGSALGSASEHVVAITRAAISCRVAASGGAAFFFIFFFAVGFGPYFALGPARLLAVAVSGGGEGAARGRALPEWLRGLRSGDCGASRVSCARPPHSSR